MREDSETGVSVPVFFALSLNLLDEALDAQQHTAPFSYNIIHPLIITLLHSLHYIDILTHEDRAHAVEVSFARLRKSIKETAMARK
jgi:hypothetical protein